MKIMTFNIQHCEYFPEKKIKFEPFKNEILYSGADIIGLNEVRGQSILSGYTEQAKKLAKLTGFNYYFAKAIDVMGIAPYGNALLSRYPVISAKTLAIPDPEQKTGDQMYESRCILNAKIKADKIYNVFVTHMGLNLDERENAIKLLLEIVPDENSIIMGDFNCTPDAKELAPLFNKFNCSDIKDFTYPSNAPKKKIDYIFTTKDLEMYDSETSENIVSDHLSQWVNIKEN